MKSTEGVSKDTVSQVTSFDLNLGEHQQKQVYAYAVLKVEGHKMISGKSWLRKENASFKAAKGCLFFEDTGLEVYSESEKNLYDCK